MKSSNNVSLSNAEKSSQTASYFTSLNLSDSLSINPLRCFFKCYAELCMALQVKPLKIIAQQNPDIILDVKTDKITNQQWSPILKALESDSSLYVIAFRCSGCYRAHQNLDTGYDIYRFGKHGSLFSYSIMNNLWTSLSHCLDATETLTHLELDGVPLGGMVNIFFKAIRRNGTLRVLSIRKCDIVDGVCQMLCTILQNKWNIRELKLTACSLGISSAEHIARLIKHQQIERCIQKWDTTVRKIHPEKKITGLRVITLQKNPGIGDEGLGLILTELFDDSWIEVLDMQSCGITDRSASDIKNLVFYNPSLQIVDFRNNKLDRMFAQKVYDILRYKRQNSLLSNLTYEKYLTEKYTKWTTIIPRVPSPTDVRRGNFFTRLFRKPKLPHSEDFEIKKESLPERIISKDLYSLPESLSAYSDEDSIFYNKKLVSLYNIQSCSKAGNSSMNRDKIFDSSDSLLEEEVIFKISL